MTEDAPILRIDKNTCQGHAKCVMECPGLLAIDDRDGKARIVKQPQGRAEIQMARRASEACPEGALSFGSENRDENSVHDKPAQSTAGRRVSRLETEFDHNTPEFAADPWSRYEDLRSQCPVAHTDAHGGFWVLSRYDDVVRVAQDDVTFSSVPTTVIPDSGVYNLIPLQSDPPDLQRYRIALLPFFTPKAVQKTRSPYSRVYIPLHRCVHREGSL